MSIIKHSTAEIDRRFLETLNDHTGLLIKKKTYMRVTVELQKISNQFYIVAKHPDAEPANREPQPFAAEYACRPTTDANSTAIKSREFSLQNFKSCLFKQVTDEKYRVKLFNKSALQRNFEFLIGDSNEAKEWHSILVEIIRAPSKTSDLLSSISANSPISNAHLQSQASGSANATAATAAAAANNNNSNNNAPKNILHKSLIPEKKFKQVTLNDCETFRYLGLSVGQNVWLKFEQSKISIFTASNTPLNVWYMKKMRKYIVNSLCITLDFSLEYDSQCCDGLLQFGVASQEDGNWIVEKVHEGLNYLREQQRLQNEPAMFVEKTVYTDMLVNPAPSENKTTPGSSLFATPASTIGAESVSSFPQNCGVSVENFLAVPNLKVESEYNIIGNIKSQKQTNSLSQLSKSYRESTDKNLSNDFNVNIGNVDFYESIDVTGRKPKSPKQNKQEK